MKAVKVGLWTILGSLVLVVIAGPFFKGPDANTPEKELFYYFPCGEGKNKGVVVKEVGFNDVKGTARAWVGNPTLETEIVQGTWVVPDHLKAGNRRLIQRHAQNQATKVALANYRAKFCP